MPLFEASYQQNKENKYEVHAENVVLPRLRIVLIIDEPDLRAKRDKEQKRNNKRRDMSVGAYKPNAMTLLTEPPNWQSLCYNLL